jgi:putative tryptophan/tyrosine transport system substrate-binding protein
MGTLRTSAHFSVLDCRYMERRKFITIFGGAALTPLAARAQLAVPVIGFLCTATAKGWAPYVAVFLEGLSETGYVDGRNVRIEYRWADGHYDRLPAMAADLIHRQVSVIAAVTTPAALAAKSATTTIPVVFTTIGDPIRLGLVASLSRPAGNVTGATQLNVEVGPKLLELLHEAVPTAASIAVLVNPTNPNTETLVRELQGAAHTRGLQLHVLQARTEHEIDAAFGTVRQQRAGGLVVSGDVVFGGLVDQLAALALRHAVPAIFSRREFVAAGGLMSYGGSNVGSFRQAGVYTGRILKGDKPGDLPVVQATKVELVINLKTAKALAVTVPLNLLGRADEVIE